MVAFYKAGSPRQKRFLSNGSPIQFTVIDVNWGVLATDNEMVIKELNQMVDEKRGGVFRSDQAEYEALKKNRTSGKPWREEMGRRGIEVNQRPVQPMQAAPIPSWVNRPPTEGSAPVAVDSRPTDPPPVAPAAATPPAPPTRPKATRKGQ